MTEIALPTSSTLSSTLTFPLSDRHLQEWKDSAVSDTIINLNVESIFDSKKVDLILNRNSKSRWKHSDNLVPAWSVSGVDPLTGEVTQQGAQVKPDTPAVSKDGRIQKYLSPSGYDTAPLFLNTGEDGYWKEIIDDVLQSVIITEGPKKAGAGLSIGYPTISIPGVSTCRKKGRLHQNLELFTKLGRTFNLCFDNDISHKEPVRKALIGLARELASKGAKVMVVVLPPGEAKGMDDYIHIHGKEAFDQLVANALTFEEWRDELDALGVEQEEAPIKSRLARQYNTIQSGWGDHLRYNSLKKKVELYGNELLADRVRLTAARTFDIDISGNDALTIVKSLAEEDTYSPVCEYLDEMENKYPDIDPSFIDGLAKEYFGSDDPTHAAYFKKFLVASVARARQPGCKVDTVFMLVSPKQGKYKSTFFRVLFGDDWFSDQLGGDVSDKDEKMKMHRFWCLEWSEFEAVYKKKDISSLKNFITSVEDTFRAPYDRDVMTYQRPCIFVGTSNEQEILHDPTGDRRFWVVPVTVPKIPIIQVLKDKDRVWAAANALYKSGFEWRLTDEEESKREELNREYRSSDYWEEIIEKLIDESSFSSDWISTESIVKALGFDDPRHLDTQSQRRLGAVMAKLGYTRKTQKVNRVSKRGWVKLADDSETLVKTDESSVTSVTPLILQGLQAVTPQNQGCNSGVTEPSGVTQYQNLTVTPQKQGCNQAVNIEPQGLQPLENSQEKSRVTVVYPPEALQNKEVTPVTLETPVSAKTYKTETQNSELPFVPANSTKPVKFKVGGTYWYKPSNQKCTIQSIFGALSDEAMAVFAHSATAPVCLDELEACAESPRWREGEQVSHIGMKKKTFTISTIRDEEIWLKNNSKGASITPILAKSIELREL